MPLRKTFIIFSLVIFFAFGNVGYTFADVSLKPDEMVKIFYYVETNSAYKSLRDNISKVSVVAPQAYSINAYGTFSGLLSKRLKKLLADNPNVKVMPLVMNSNFNQNSVHLFLKNNKAEDLAISKMVAFAQKNNFSGFQLDFEHMSFSDRDAYSTFVEKVGSAFHQNNLTLSVAVAPRQSEKPADYPKNSFANWSGVFDYKRIGDAADFVTLMAYDEPNVNGPVASIGWVRQSVDYVLSFIDAKKVSLGLPFYAWTWHESTGKRIAISGWKNVANILAKNKTKSGWDSELGTSWITYNGARGKYKIWYEDYKSFDAKLALVQEKKLQGFSAWMLGLEDPKIWTAMDSTNVATFPIALAENTR